MTHNQAFSLLSTLEYERALKRFAARHRIKDRAEAERLFALDVLRAHREMHPSPRRPEDFDPFASASGITIY